MFQIFSDFTNFIHVYLQGFKCYVKNLRIISSGLYIR